MRRIGKYLVPMLKYGTFAVVTVAISAFGYLKYINSQLGPIQWNKDEVVPDYKQRYSCTEEQAVKMYE